MRDLRHIAMANRPASDMLTMEQFRYLDQIIRENSTLRARRVPYPFDDGHVPQHNWCQVTALHLERSPGFNAQIGIQWVDKSGFLLPWPHMVNWSGNVLTDYSAPVAQRKFAFTLKGDDLKTYREITVAIEAYDANWLVSARVDPYLAQLHHDWFAKLSHFEAGSAAIFNPRRAVT
jgi:hypothetical protein